MRRRFIQNSLKGFDFDNYLTIEALEDGLTVSMSNTLEYCINGDNEWKVLSKNGFTESINTGEVISFRGKLFPEISGRGIGTFVISKRCNIKGNCMSLIFKDDAKYNFNLPSVWGLFFELFNNCTTIKDASNLILQATGLAPSCYSHMFYGCYNLEGAPKLPATELYNNCYESMFKRCSNLTTAPELLAPILKAGCYRDMFEDCSRLTYIKMLAIDISASNCLMYWTVNVASSGTFVKHPDMVDLSEDSSGIPYRWNVVNDGEENLGKTVNTLTLKPFISEMMKELCIDYTFEYIPTSTIIVDINTNGLEGLSLLHFYPETTSLHGTRYAVDLHCESNIITIYDYTPKEDVKYIYEVKVEY